MAYRITYWKKGVEYKYRNRFTNLDNAIRRAKIICASHNFLALVKVHKVTALGWEKVVRTI